jgi:hypothetical protein
MHTIANKKMTPSTIIRLNVLLCWFLKELVVVVVVVVVVVATGVAVAAAIVVVVVVATGVARGIEEE